MKVTPPLPQTISGYGKVKKYLVVLKNSEQSGNLIGKQREKKKLEPYTITIYIYIHIYFWF